MVDVTDGMATVIDTAIKSGKPTILRDTPGKIWLHHPGMGITSLDTSAALVAPVRKTGLVTVYDANSFNAVIAENSDAGNIAVYVDSDPHKPAIVAVLNGNGKSGPGWGDFRVKLVFRKTPQWEKWNQIDGKFLAQQAFAEFIEDNIEDIAEPSGATMLEIATYLEATKTTNFRSGIRLSSGAVQFQNLEDIDAKVGAGRIEIPETFKLGIAPFYGFALYAVPCKFRYRLSEGKLGLGFKLQRVEDLMGKLISDMLTAIGGQGTYPILEGVPPQ